MPAKKNTQNGRTGIASGKTKVSDGKLLMRMTCENYAVVWGSPSEGFSGDWEGSLSKRKAKPLGRTKLSYGAVAQRVIPGVKKDKSDNRVRG